MIFEGLLAPEAHVSIDDGGVRCVGPDSGQYVAFATLADAAVEFHVLGVTLLRLVGRDGSRTTVRIPKSEALEAQADILQRIATSPEAETNAALGEAALARGNRPLTQWLEAVARWATSGAGYRNAALDPATATATLRDPRVAQDIRAACVHAMLSTCDEEELTAVARTFVERALPPLVVVAARLGRGGAALVPDAMVEDVLPLLSPEDQADTRRAMTSPVTHDDEAHVHEVMDRVKQAVLVEANERRAQQVHKRPAFHARPLGSYAGEQGISRFK
jgi:hypothetical protein